MGHIRSAQNQMQVLKIKKWPLLQAQLPQSKEVYYFLFAICENQERTVHSHLCYHQHAEGARK